MRITVKLVGVFKIGRFGDEILECPEASSVADLVKKLGIPAPLLGIVLINGIHAGVDDKLEDGDSLCLLPFIDGG